MGRVRAARVLCVPVRRCTASSVELPGELAQPENHERSLSVGFVGRLLSVLVSASPSDAVSRSSFGLRTCGSAGVCWA
jgi:hypothetical protein